MITMMFGKVATMSRLCQDGKYMAKTGVRIDEIEQEAIRQNKGQMRWDSSQNSKAEMRKIKNKLNSVLKGEIS